MSWVKEALAGLKAEQQVKVRPHGGSMRGRIESGQCVTLAPATITDIQADDIVFVRWKGNYLLHIALEVEADRVLIGNNLGKVNGHVPADAILGRVVAVED